MRVASRGLLLDTHVFLWWRMNDPGLSEPARTRITEAPVVFVSAASAWEASIKIALGKLTLPEPFEDGVTDSGFDELPIRFEHARIAGALPPHHADPFDRMLVAQAQVERLALVTHDQAMAPYAADVFWV